LFQLKQFLDRHHKTSPQQFGTTIVQGITFIGKEM